MKNIVDFVDDKYKRDESFDSLFDDLLEIDEIHKIVVDYDLKTEDLQNSMIDLLKFQKEKELMKDKNYLENNNGFYPEISYNGKKIVLVYKRDPKFLEKKNENKIFLYMPEELYDASLEDVSLVSDERRDINLYATRFIRFYSPAEYIKGLYLTGPFRTGKSYFLSAIAKELSLNGYKVVLMHYPDFSRNIKSLIDSGELDDMVEYYKNVDILMLDDIGGGYLSQYVRDEILEPILDYRLRGEKPTFFSSNYPLSRLASAFRKDGSEEETIKALRVTARIKELSEEMKLTEPYKN